MKKLESKFGALTIAMSLILALGLVGSCQSKLEVETAGTYQPTEDELPPFVTISANTETLTNKIPIELTFTFNKNVAGFVSDDISLDNAQITSFSGGPSQYIALVEAESNGTVTVNVGAGIATDSAGNENLPAEEFSLEFDGIGPKLSITSTESSPTQADIIVIEFEFDEAVSGFSLEDITVKNGSIGGLAGGPKLYSASVTPLTDGAVEITVLAASVVDQAQNPNDEDSLFTITYGGSAPRVFITSTEPNPTNSASFSTKITFDEDVSGFTKSDITTTNATVTSLSGGPRVYTAVISPVAIGLVTVDVAAEVAVDIVNTGNFAASQFNLSYDPTGLSILIGSTSSSPTNNAVIPVTFTFNKNAIGFDISDVVVSNGSISNLSGGPTVFTATVAALGEGNVTIDVPQGSATDVAGNVNAAGGQLALLFDSTAPSLSITSAESSPTKKATFVATFTFSEDVTGFTVSDIAPTNASISGFTGGPKIYTAVVQPSADGAVNIDVGSGIAADLATNTNIAVTQFSISSDRTAPTVSISSAASSPNNTATFDVAIQFSEVISEFDLSGITVGNGTVSNFGGANKDYTATITPTGEGEVTVDIPENKAVDAAMNGNLAASQFSLIHDTIKPNVTITSSEPSPTNRDFTVTITFDEDVTGFVSSDLVVVNGTTDPALGGPKVYTVLIKPIADGTVSVDLPANKVQDLASNGNNAASQFSLVHDTSSLLVFITTSETSPSNAASTSATFQFSRAVTGFIAGDISLTNASLANFSGSGSAYTADITPTADGLVTIDVAPGVALDSLSVANLAATKYTIDFDTVSPTLSITSVEASPTNAGAIFLNFTFDENVSGFTESDIVLVNGTLAGFAGSGSVYTATLTPQTDGLVSVTVPQGIAVDAANNLSDAGSWSLTYDATPPTLVISSSETSPTKASPFTVDFIFDSPVENFTVTDLNVVNGSASLFTGTGAAYSAKITPANDGVVSVDVPSNVATDLAGNQNTAAPQYSILYDKISPTVAITAASVSDPTNVSSFVATVIFSEAVLGFDISDITPVNASLSAFAGSGDTYTVTVAPISNGLVSFNIGAGAATDAATNPNISAPTYSTTYDNILPTVSLTSPVASPSNASSFIVTFSFSEAINGFTQADISVGNGSITGFSGSSPTFTATIAPTADGLVTVDVGAGKSVDLATNPNAAATQFSLIYDGNAPTLSITTGESDPTNSVSFAATFTFSESVIGFDATDVVVTNGVLSGFGGSGSLYTGTITPTGDGLVTIDVAGGTSTDASLNASEVSQYTINSDRTSPTLILSSAEPDPSDNGMFIVNLTFSELVVGLLSSEISVGNGALISISGSGASYSATIAPASEGLVTVDVAGGVAGDSAGNLNSAATQFTLTYDTTGPSVGISSAEVSPTKNTPFTATFTFDSNVTGFQVTDITVGNGSAATLSGGPSVYTAVITPAADGNVTLDVLSNKVIDAAGNSNLASPQFSLLYDSTPPTLAITTGEANPTNAAAYTATFTFSEPVTGFVSGDISASNASISLFSGSAAVYTATITPIADGAVTINVSANAAADAAGNLSLIAPQYSVLSDRTGPTLAISSLESNPTNTTPFLVTFSFAEDVTGFAAADVTVGNGTLASLSGSNAVYTALITPTLDGAVTVDVGGGVASDTAGNGNIAAPQFGIAYDGSSPTVVISTVESSPSKSVSFVADIIFSEAVTGFSVGDIIANNAGLSGFTGSGTTYAVTVTPVVDGSVTLDIGAGSAFDNATNANTAATQISVVHDTVSPTITTTLSQSSPTNSGTFIATFSFSESVTGFTLADVDVINGSASAFSGSANSYTATITPAAEGVVSIDVSAGVAADAATNPNLVAAQIQITYDITRPTVALSTAAADPTNLNPFSVSIAFSEAVSGLAATDFSVTNGVAGNLAGSGASYTIDITPSSDGLVSVDLIAGISADAAGNTNLGATTISRTYDGTLPTVTISCAEISPTLNTPFTISFAFSESVSGFVVGDVVVGNGVASALTGGPVNYSATVTPTASGIVTIDVPVNSVADPATNGNVASTQYSLVFDALAPVAGGSPLSSSLLPFSVDVSWLAASDNYSIPANISYELRQSLSNNMGTLANAEANGTIISAYAANNLSAAVTGLNDITNYYFTVIAKDQAGNKIVYPTMTVFTPDGTPPTLPNSVLAKANIRKRTVDLSWVAAADNYSAVSALVYQVYYSSSNNISSVIDAETNGISFGTNVNRTSLQLTGLMPSGDYFLQVIVSDEAGNKTSYGSTQVKMVEAVSAVYSDKTDTFYMTDASGSWVSSTIDAGVDATKDNTIVRGNDGSVHVLYYGKTSQNLYYQKLVSGTWTKVQVAGDSAASLDSGSRAEMALDSANNVHITYYEDPNLDLNYAKMVSGSFVSESIHSVNGEDFGRGLSSLIDGNGQIISLYNDDANTEGYRASGVSGNWTVAGPMADSVDSSSMDLAANGDIHGVFEDNTSLDLFYIKRTAAGVWGTPSLITSQDVDTGVSMKWDGSEVHACYYEDVGGNGTDFQLNYVHGLPGSWTFEVVDDGSGAGSVDVGVKCSLTIGFHGFVHISYYDGDNKKYLYAYKSGGVWVKSVIGTEGKAGAILAD